MIALPSFLLALAAASLPAVVNAQDEQMVFDAEHNATTLIGTWSSGSRQVITGAVRYAAGLFCIQELTS
jgi:hypothetical protein